MDGARDNHGIGCGWGSGLPWDSSAVPWGWGHGYHGWSPLWGEGGITSSSSLELIGIFNNDLRAITSLDEPRDPNVPRGIEST
ncbi:hypothetical protein CDAR_573111 [Caerostris darwini]|uniref:Uncharacterized protein n=1 Tax=Caerostris darwini TaxID=1538125 RepID=A0AAV4W7Q3_9ARAC|nr:hypothetical protein CDAR_573111 [Caerostris darwini]